MGGLTGVGLGRVVEVGGMGVGEAEGWVAVGVGDGRGGPDARVQAVIAVAMIGTMASAANSRPW
jgi:hypothetical protein